LYLIEEVLAMVETGIDLEDELILAMHEELERAFNKDKCEVDTANVEREKQKRVMMDMVMSSVRTQRLYFVVRSAIMSLVSALITFIIVGYLGIIDVVQAVFLGIFLFVGSLIVSRLFDRQIVKVSKKIIRVLDRHKRARAFILKNL
jgi:hypothetical protein